MSFLGQRETGLVHVGAGEGPAYWMVGDTYTLKLSAAATGGALGLVEASIPPGSGPPPHCHSREDEAFYLLSGSLEVSAGEKTVTAGPGETVFLPRGIVHSFRNVSDEVVRALIIVTPGGFEGYFAEAGDPARSGTPAPPPGPAEIERVLTTAPRYAVDIAAPPDA